VHYSPLSCHILQNYVKYFHNLLLGVLAVQII
jgi:hypothetical protein